MFCLSANIKQGIQYIYSNWFESKQNHRIQITTTNLICTNHIRSSLIVQSDIGSTFRHLNIPFVPTDCPFLQFFSLPDLNDHHSIRKNIGFLRTFCYHNHTIKLSCFYKFLEVKIIFLQWEGECYLTNGNWQC